MPFLADCLQGRINLHSAVYRKAHDTETVIWMTLDGQELFRYGGYPFQLKQDARYSEAKCALPARPFEFNMQIFQSDWYKASQNLLERITQQLYQEGEFDSYYVLTGLMDYPNLSIEAARVHENLFIRGFALLDRRFGKRRFAQLDIEQLTSFEKLCYDLRIDLDGIKV